MTTANVTVIQLDCGSVDCRCRTCRIQSWKCTVQLTWQAVICNFKLNVNNAYSYVVICFTSVLNRLPRTRIVVYHCRFRISILSGPSGCLALLAEIIQQAVVSTLARMRDTARVRHECTTNALPISDGRDIKSYHNWGFAAFSQLSKLNYLFSINVTRHLMKQIYKIHIIRSRVTVWTLSWYPVTVKQT